MHSEVVLTHRHGYSTTNAKHCSSLHQVSVSSRADLMNGRQSRYTCPDVSLHDMSVCVLKAQKDAGECHIKIPVITFDSPEEEKQEMEDGEEATVLEDDSTLKHTTSQSEEFHLCRETTSSEFTTLECPDPEQEHVGLQMTNDSTPSPQLTNDNSSSGIDVHSHPDDTDPLDPNVDSQGFLRLPPALARYGPGGRTHIRGLSMDSGKDAVLLSGRSHNTVCWLCFYFCMFIPHPSVHAYITNICLFIRPP